MYKKCCDWCKKKIIDRHATLELCRSSGSEQSWGAMLCEDCVLKVEDLAIKSQAGG